VSSAGVQLDVAPRRRLSERRASTVQRLADATVVELAESGSGALTVRLVAKRAGVAPATAYTYFASKEHLVAEVFWRRLNALPERKVDKRRSTVGRVTDVLMDFALSVAEETELAAACTVALLADDEEVRDLRGRIGAELHRRLKVAAGDDIDPTVLIALELTTTGALLQVGTGHLGYQDLPDLLGAIAARLLAYER